MARPRRSPGHQRVREALAKRYEASEAREPLTGILLDSDVVIEILRGTKEIVEAAEQFARDGVPTYCTAINWAEVFAGARAGEESATQAFFDARGEVVLDAVTGRRAGHYLARYSRSHRVAIDCGVGLTPFSTHCIRLSSDAASSAGLCPVWAFSSV